MRVKAEQKRLIKEHKEKAKVQSNSKPGQRDDSDTPLKQPSILSRMLKIGLPVLISAGLVIWIYCSIDEPEAVWETLTSISTSGLLLLIAIVPISLLSHLLRAWRWRRFIGQPVSIFYAFTSVMIGYAVNDVLPRVGEAARVVNMNRMTRAPIARLISTLLAERLIDVISLALLLSFSFLVEGERIAREIPSLERIGLKALAVALAGLAGLFLVAYASGFLEKTCGGLVSKVHSGFGRKVKELIRQATEGLEFLKQPSQAVPIFLETTGIWALYLVCFLFGLAAFGLLDVTGYAGGTVSFSIATAGVLVPTMGAIGAYHKCGMDSLTRLYNIDQASAIAFITVIHAVLFYVVGGILSALAWGMQVWVRKRLIRENNEAHRKP